MVYPNTLGKLLKRPLWLGVLFVFLGLILGIFAGFAIARQQEGPFPSRDWIKKDDDGRTFFINKSSGDLCHLSIYSGDKDRWTCDIHDGNGKAQYHMYPCRWKWPWGVVCAEDKTGEQRSATVKKEQRHFTASSKPLFQGWLKAHLTDIGKADAYAGQVKQFGKKRADEAAFYRFKNEFQSFIKDGGAVQGTKPYGAAQQATTGTSEIEKK